MKFDKMILKFIYKNNGQKKNRLYCFEEEQGTEC